MSDEGPRKRQKTVVKTALTTAASSVYKRSPRIYASLNRLLTYCGLSEDQLKDYLDNEQLFKKPWDTHVNEWIEPTRSKPHGKLSEDLDKVLRCINENIRKEPGFYTYTYSLEEKTQMRWGAVDFAADLVEKCFMQGTGLASPFRDMHLTDAELYLRIWNIFKRKITVGAPSRTRKCDITPRKHGNQQLKVDRVTVLRKVKAKVRP